MGAGAGGAVTGAAVALTRFAVAAGTGATIGGGGVGAAAGDAVTGTAGGGTRVVAAGGGSATWGRGAGASIGASVGSGRGTVDGQPIVIEVVAGAGDAGVVEIVAGRAVGCGAADGGAIAGRAVGTSVGGGADATVTVGLGFVHAPVPATVSSSESAASRRFERRGIAGL